MSVLPQSGPYNQFSEIKKQKKDLNASSPSNDILNKPCNKNDSKVRQLKDNCTIKVK